MTDYSDIVEALRKEGNHSAANAIDALQRENKRLREGACSHGVPESEHCALCRVDAGEIGVT